MEKFIVLGGGVPDGMGPKGKSVGFGGRGVVGVPWRVYRGVGRGRGVSRGSGEENGPPHY